MNAAITASMLGTGTRPAAAQAEQATRDAAQRRPSVMSPMTRRAVWGSNRSLITDQKPETTVAPKMAMCRYTATAARRGIARLTPHSASSSTVPAASMTGTTRAGERRERAAENARTAAADTTAAAIITTGSDETENVERKRVSRVARPATCWATSAPAATMPAITALR